MRYPTTVQRNLDISKIKSRLFRVMQGNINYQVHKMVYSRPTVYSRQYLDGSYLYGPLFSVLTAFRRVDNNKGFSLLGIVISMFIMLILTGAVISSLYGEMKLAQAKTAINTINSLTGAETQYQLVLFNNNPSLNNYFGNIQQLQQGILVNGIQQYYLPANLLNINTVSDCISNEIGSNNTVVSCLQNLGSNTFTVTTSGIPPNMVQMFKNGVYNIPGSSISGSGGNMIMSVPVKQITEMQTEQNLLNQAQAKFNQMQQTEQSLMAQENLQLQNIQSQM